MEKMKEEKYGKEETKISSVCEMIGMIGAVRNR
jgi:hypothetical protein